jgi:myosin-3
LLSKMVYFLGGTASAYPHVQSRRLRSPCSNFSTTIFPFHNHVLRYDELLHCMSVLRISAQEVAAFEGVLATILHIGNIEFVTDANDADRIQVRSVRALMSAAGLVGASTVALARVLLTSEQVTRGEKIVKRLTMSQAADARDAAAKSLYGSLFRWVVGKINTFLIPRQDIANGIEIGVLDIFGFENFEVNSFEQLCINVANEQLQ